MARVRRVRRTSEPARGGVATRRRDEEEDVEEDEDDSPRQRRSARSPGRSAPSSRNGRSSSRSSRVDDEDEEDYEDDEDDEYEDEEEERPRSKARVGDDGEMERGGWGTFHKNRENAPSDFLQTLKITKDEQLGHFMDEKPFASEWTHWIDELPRGWRKSWRCLNQSQKKGGGGCPLCEMGDTPKLNTYFNVLSFEDPDEPEVRVYNASMTQAETLYQFGENEKYAPLNNPGVYYEMQMVGERHQFRPVKKAAIAEDWSKVLPDGPLTEDELDEYDEDCWEAEALPMHTRKDLLKVKDYLDKKSRD